MLSITPEIIIAIPAILLALTIHEYSHGYAAFLCGDSTAKNMGRLTFNPISHLDLLGTIMIIGTLVSQFVPFGWAKPVPVDIRFLRNPKRDIMIVSFAGPLSNIILATISAILITILSKFPILYLQTELHAFLRILFTVNVGLAIFNMLPIPPLDGSKIIMGILPQKLLRTYLEYSNHLSIAFIILLVLESTMQIRTLSYVFGPIYYFLRHLFPNFLL
jgi:Zn-dependent protease